MSLDNENICGGKLTDFINRIHLSPEIDRIAGEMKEEIRACVNAKIDNYMQKVFRLRTISVAASLAILLSFVGIYFYSDNSKKEKQIRIEVAKGVITQTLLPDGTKVILNSGSVLTYQSEFHSSREVYLEGEAYFDVVHKNEKPFIVKSEQLQVVVYGTQFNVQSYLEHKNIEVTLLKGSVGIIIEGQTDNIYLSPGRQLTYDKVYNNLSQKEISPQLYISWINGGLYFNQKTLEEISVILEKHFDKKICITSERLKKMVFTGEFKANENLQDILHIIALDERMEYLRIEDTVYLKERD